MSCKALSCPFLVSVGIPLFLFPFCSYGFVNLITHYSKVSFEVFTLVQASFPFCSYVLVNLITHYSEVSFEVCTLEQALLFSGPLCF